MESAPGANVSGEGGKDVTTRCDVVLTGLAADFPKVPVEQASKSEGHPISRPKVGFTPSMYNSHSQRRSVLLVQKRAPIAPGRRKPSLAGSAKVAVVRKSLPKLPPRPRGPAALQSRLRSNTAPSSVVQDRSSLEQVRTSDEGEGSPRQRSSSERGLSSLEQGRKATDVGGDGELESSSGVPSQALWYALYDYTPRMAGEVSLRVDATLSNLQVGFQCELKALFSAPL